MLCYVVELAVGSEQKLYFCYDSSDPVGQSMIPIKTIVIEQVRRDISSVKQAYVKLACNRVISPGISHIACESVETAIQTFMFGCLFSIFHHAIKNVSLIENRGGGQGGRGYGDIGCGIGGRGCGIGGRGGGKRE